MLARLKIRALLRCSRSCFPVVALLALVLGGFSVASLIKTPDSHSSTGRPPTVIAGATIRPTPAPAVFLSAVGDDSSCARGNPLKPCATFDRAYKIAQGGDTVAVDGGQYAQDAPSIGGNAIHPAAKTGTVTFTCAGTGDITFAGPVFHFWAGTSGVTIQGKCFHFHAVYIGEGGYADQTHDITLDRVHVEVINIIGANRVTVSHSEVGPFVSCGVPEMPASAACDPGSYWSQFTNGTDASGLSQPFIHGGASGPATNINFDRDHIHGITSKWVGTHTGGLLLWNVNGLRITNSVFDHNAIYDIDQVQTSSDSNVLLNSNTFGVPVYSQDPSEPSPGGPLPTDWREVAIGGDGNVLANWLIRLNRFSHGLNLNAADGQLTNVSVLGNVLGTYTTCVAAPGVTFDSNISVGRTCGTNGLRVRGFPYLDYANGDYRIMADSPVACFLVDVRSGKFPPKAKCPKPS